MNKKSMRSFLTLNNIKYLCHKWNKYIYLVIFVIIYLVIQINCSISFEIKTVYAMEEIKKGLYYAKIKFDFVSLRDYCLKNTQICENRLNDVLGKSNLDMNGLFRKNGHMFFIHENKKFLSSLTHSPSFKRDGSIIENILISKKDYRNWNISADKPKLISEESYLDWNKPDNKFRDTRQYLGDLFDYVNNEYFLETIDLTNEDKRAFESYYNAYETTIEKGLEKQQCQKRAIILLDDIKKASGNLYKIKIKQ